MHLNIIDEPFDARDALGDLLCDAFFSVAIGTTCQNHDPAFYRDADLIWLEPGIPHELAYDILIESRVRLHTVCSGESSKRDRHARSLTSRRFRAPGLELPIPATQAP